RDCVAFDGLVAQPGAAVIEGDYHELARQLFDKLLRPSDRTQPISHHQHKRRPLALHAIGEIDAVHPGKTRSDVVFLCHHNPETRWPPSTVTTLPVMKDPASEISSSKGPSSS